MCLTLGHNRSILFINYILQYHSNEKCRKIMRKFLNTQILLSKK